MTIGCRPGWVPHFSVHAVRSVCLAAQSSLVPPLSQVPAPYRAGVPLQPVPLPHPCRGRAPELPHPAHPGRRAACHHGVGMCTGGGQAAAARRCPAICECFCRRLRGEAGPAASAHQSRRVDTRVCLQEHDCFTVRVACAYVLICVCRSLDLITQCGFWSLRM